MRAQNSPYDNCLAQNVSSAEAENPTPSQGRIVGESRYTQCPLHQVLQQREGGSPEKGLV